MDDSTLMTAEDVIQAQNVLDGGRGVTHDAGFYRRILSTYHALAEQTEEVARLKEGR